MRDPQTTPLMILDPSTYEKRPATQEDIDLLENYVWSFSKCPVPDEEPLKETFPFRLAAYVNKQRSDMLFVAEEKEIEPYPGITDVDGSPCYPSTPRTQYCCPMGMEPNFAREIVRRWNEKA